MATFNVIDAQLDARAHAVTGELINFGGGTVVQLQDAVGDIFLGSDAYMSVVAGNGSDTIYGGLAGGQIAMGAGNDWYVGGGSENATFNGGGNRRRWCGF